MKERRIESGREVLDLSVANGIVIHLQTGEEKRTEFFLSDHVRVGTDAACDLRLVPSADHAPNNGQSEIWLELERHNGFYRVSNYKDSLKITLNDRPLGFHATLDDGDRVEIPGADLQLSFFSLSENRSALATAASPKGARMAQFIENAALEAGHTPERDDAKAFLREFTRELLREITWVSKLIVLVIVIAALSGVFYLGFALYNEMQRSRVVAEEQGQIIAQLRDELAKNRDEIGNLNKTNKQIIDLVSLAPTLRNEYGNGICLLVGTYDLVDRQSAKQLRFPDPTMMPTPDPFESQNPSQQQQPPQVAEDGGDAFAQNSRQMQQPPLTTEGGGSPVEYDFVGTGFHVGGGYVVTNRHVVQPWSNDERVKVLAQLSNGRARLRRLVVYFPNLPNPVPLRVREISSREDIAVASIDPNAVSPDIPVLPLDADSDAVSIGKTVVTMGYPNGPDRILAMVDESEARSIQSRFGSTLQTLINFLSQTKRIQPLTTQGTITDLQDRRIVHDAKTAEGGSGAPLFGQSGRVIGVNFGVFTENTANNMAIPIKFVIPMLERAGWKSPEAKEKLDENKTNDKKMSANANAAPPLTTAKNQ